MSRSIRIEFPDAIYHVTSRGNAQSEIYLSDSDRLLFVETLSQVVKRYGWLCHAYCLMDNHYHLMIQTPQANLAQGVRHLNNPSSCLELFQLLLTHAIYNIDTTAGFFTPT